MKAILKAVTGIMLIASMCMGLNTPSVLAGTGDNYPLEWKNLPLGATSDTWGYATRYCTSWVAWALHDRNGFEMPVAAGNAWEWGYVFAHLKNATPAVGSVAWWDKQGSGPNSLGHVAYVSAVNGDQVTVEEYNVPAGSGLYHTRTFHKSQVSGYLHFHDLPGGGGNPYPGYGPKLASIGFQDGRLAVFYVGTDNSIRYRLQDTPGGNWSGGEYRIDAHVKALAVTASHDSRIELFAIGGDNAVYHWWQDQPNSSTWLGPNRYPANVYSLAAARNGTNLVELYAVGHGTADVYRRVQTSPNSWAGSTWVNMPADVWEVAATTSHDNRTELFMVGHDNALWHRWQTSPGGAWSADEMQPAAIAKVAAARNADGRLEVFALGPDNKVYNKWQQQTGANWSGWEDDLLASGKSLAAGRNADGRLELFVVGGDNRVWHLWQQTAGGNWSGAYGLEGFVAG